MNNFIVITLLFLTNIFASESEALRAMRLGCDRQKVALGCYNYANLLIQKDEKNLAEKYFDKGCKLGNSSSCDKKTWEADREPTSETPLEPIKTEDSNASQELKNIDDTDVVNTSTTAEDLESDLDLK